jgi:hypothetical protein
LVVGDAVGFILGKVVVGDPFCVSLGILVGLAVGDSVGCKVGYMVGYTKDNVVGFILGCTVVLDVGFPLGPSVGWNVGRAVGVALLADDESVVLNTVICINGEVSFAIDEGIRGYKQSKMTIFMRSGVMSLKWI